MNNSLSEQVAELEADHARLGRKMFRLEAERNDLQRQVQEARDEAAELRAGQVQEARDQIATLRAGQGRWPKPDDFLCCGSQPTGYADDAQEENADLRAKLDRANDDMEGHLLADSIVDAENEVIAATTVPRLITADELREGQTVTASVDAMFRKPDDWEVFEVEKDSSGMYLSNTTIDMHASNADQIVLLADAPQPTSYADDDHQDAEVTQWWNPEPETTATRLTATDGTMWEVSVRMVKDATLTTPEAQ